MRAADLPMSIATLRQAGPLNIELRTNAAHDVSLYLEPQYTTQTLGDRLTTEQIARLDQVRAEAPEKFEILQCLFPRQIAEYLLRTNATAAPVAPADDAVQRLVLEIAGDYLTKPMPGDFTEGQRHARREFLQTALTKLPVEQGDLRNVIESAARYEDPDFGTTEKTNAFLALQNQYSPFKPVGMSLIGDTLSINGKIVTEQLGRDAASARRDPEQLAFDRYNALCREFTRWRDGQLTGNAYAGTIKSFLNDPRLATFTPEEIHRAYRRVFGRDLKIDLQADRVAAQTGHPITYNELQSRHQ